MKVAVWNEGIWKPSKEGDGYNKRVSFKSLEEDETKGKTFYLNMTDYEIDNNSHQAIKDKWEQYCKNGNILNVPLFNNKTINKYGQFDILQIKPVNESEEV